MELPSLSEFKLAGGTALALVKGHRTSIDIDLFSESTPDTALLLGELEVHTKTEVLLHKENSTLLLSLNGIKTDIIRHKYPEIGTSLTIDGIRLYSLKDIAAMKVGAIISRGARKDFTDLYFLLEDFSIEEMIGFYIQKYKQAEKFYILKSLVYFDDAEKEAGLNMLRPISWEEVKAGIRKSAGI